MFIRTKTLGGRAVLFTHEYRFIVEKSIQIRNIYVVLSQNLKAMSQLWGIEDRPEMLKGKHILKMKKHSPKLHVHT